MAKVKVCGWTIKQIIAFSMFYTFASKCLLQTFKVFYGQMCGENRTTADHIHSS